jgi:hypothetical protein
VLVTLTKEGLLRADRLLAIKTETEQRLFGRVDRDTLARMSTDLRTLLLVLEGPAGAPPEEVTATPRRHRNAKPRPKPTTPARN